MYSDHSLSDELGFESNFEKQLEKIEKQLEKEQKIGEEEEQKQQDENRLLRRL